MAKFSKKSADSRYDALYKAAARRTGLDWKLLKAQGLQESGLNPQAESPVGAQGIAQFMPQTWREWHDGTPGTQGEPSISPFDPEAAINAQADYMKWLLKQTKGNLELALAGYNFGIGNVRRLLRSCKDWKAGLPKETRNYVERIKALREKLEG